jgi:hypothetical protein
MSFVARQLGVSFNSISGFLKEEGHPKSIGLNTRFPIELEDKLNKAIEDGTMERKIENKTSLFQKEIKPLCLPH